MAVDVVAWLNGGSAALFIVFGLFVAYVSKGRRPAVAFAAFCLLFGAARLLTNLSLPGWDSHLGLWIAVIYLLDTGALIALVQFALTYPEPLSGPARARLILPAVVVLAYVAFALAMLAMQWDSGSDEAAFIFSDFPPLLAEGFLVLGYIVVSSAGFFFALLVLAGRFAAAASHLGDAEIRQYGLMGVGLVLYPAAHVGSELIWLARSVGEPWRSNELIAGIALFVISVVVWLRAMASTRGLAARTSRAVALIGLVVAFLSVAFLAATDIEFVGAARVIAVAILAYGITRHDVLGLDWKVRFALSKSTLAAVFVAVFFVASEAAQEFFGAQAGSQYIGILAAGFLVFAISPLSRLADRLAEKALPVDATPVGPSAGRLDSNSADAIYRAAARAAMRDGTMTRREEMHLAEIAERVGLGHRRALQIRAAVEQEKE